MAVDRKFDGRQQWQRALAVGKGEAGNPASLSCYLYVRILTHRAVLQWDGSVPHAAPGSILPMFL